MGWLNNYNSSNKKGGGMMWILLLLAACCCILCSSSSALIAFSEDVRKTLGLDDLFGDNDDDTPPPNPPATTEEETTTTADGAWVCPRGSWTGYKFARADADGVMRCWTTKDGGVTDKSRPVQISGDQLTADVMMQTLKNKTDSGNKLYVDGKGNSMWRDVCPCPAGNTEETLNFALKDSQGRPAKMYCMTQGTGGLLVSTGCTPKCSKGQDADGKEQYVNGTVTSLDQCEGGNAVLWRRW